MSESTENVNQSSIDITEGTNVEKNNGTTYKTNNQNSDFGAVDQSNNGNDTLSTRLDNNDKKQQDPEKDGSFNLFGIENTRSDKKEERQVDHEFVINTPMDNTNNSDDTKADNSSLKLFESQVKKVNSSENAYDPFASITKTDGANSSDSSAINSIVDNDISARVINRSEDNTNIDSSNRDQEKRDNVSVQSEQQHDFNPFDNQNSGTPFDPFGSNVQGFTFAEGTNNEFSFSFDAFPANVENGITSFTFDDASDETSKTDEELFSKFLSLIPNKCFEYTGRPLNELFSHTDTADDMDSAFAVIVGSTDC